MRSLAVLLFAVLLSLGSCAPRMRRDLDAVKPAEVAVEAAQTSIPQVPDDAKKDGDAPVTVPDGQTDGGDQTDAPAVREDSDVTGVPSTDKPQDGEVKAPEGAADAAKDTTPAADGATKADGVTDAPKDDKIVDPDLVKQSLEAAAGQNQKEIGDEVGPEGRSADDTTDAPKTDGTKSDDAVSAGTDTTDKPADDAASTSSDVKVPDVPVLDAAAVPDAPKSDEPSTTPAGETKSE